MENRQMNSGALFANENKLTDTHPTHTGTVNIEGREFWLSAWVKTSKNGKRYFSLSVRAKDAAGKPAAKTQPAPAEADPFDDDVPFNWVAA